jgi:hypothetical protein
MLAAEYDNRSWLAVSTNERIEQGPEHVDEKLADEQVPAGAAFDRRPAC